MAEIAECASRAVGREHPSSEHRLMQAPTHGRHGVLASRRKIDRVVERERLVLISHQGIEREHEGFVLRFFAHEPHGKHGYESGRRHANEPCERLALDMGGAKGSIVKRLRIVPLPLVTVVAVGPLRIGIGEVAWITSECRSNCECGRQARNHPDSPHVLKERQALSSERERHELFLAHHIGIDRNLLQIGEHARAQFIVLLKERHCREYPSDDSAAPAGKTPPSSRCSTTN